MLLPHLAQAGQENKMATFTQYTKKNGTKAWQYQTYLGIDEVTGKKKYTTRRGFISKKSAQLALNKLLLDVEENGFNKIKVSTFEELYERWLKLYENKVKPSTFYNTDNMMQTVILPKFGKLRLDKITVSYCQSVLNEWHENYRSFGQYKIKLNLVLDFAVSLELMDSNPMQKTQMPRKAEKEKKDNFYTREELLDFLTLTKKDIDPKKHVFFYLLAFTGMRVSEALALQWQDIDFFNKTVTVAKTVAKVKSGIIVQTPKTKSSARVLDVDAQTIQVLKSWQSQQRELYFKRGFNTNSPEQFLFTTFGNRLINSSAVAAWLELLYREHTHLKKITPHGLRHTHCSLLFTAGVSIKEVQQRLGHTDIYTTMNIYAHVMPEQKKEVADKFAQFMNL